MVTWVGSKSGTSDAATWCYDISYPGTPELMNLGTWSQIPPLFDYFSNQDATFAADHLWLAGYSVLIRLENGCTIEPSDEIFADGFESGDVGAW